MNWPDLVPWIIGVLALAAIGAGVWWWLAARDARRAQVRKQHTMSASRDMLGRREIAVRHLSNPDRMVFGKLVDAQSAEVLTEELVMDDSDAPCEVLGAPGSGKTYSMLTPACVRHRGPALISTTKLDLAQQTLGARRHHRAGDLRPRGGSTHRARAASSCAGLDTDHGRGDVGSRAACRPCHADSGAGRRRRAAGQCCVLDDALNHCGRGAPRLPAREARQQFARPHRAGEEPRRRTRREG